MSLAKAMSYETVPVTAPKSAKRVNTKLTSNLLEQVSTSSLLWHVVTRHKYGLVVCGVLLENVLLVLHFFTVI